MRKSICIFLLMAALTMMGTFHSTARAAEVESHLVIQKKGGDKTIVHSGAEVRLVMKNGKRLKGKIIILSKNLVLLEGSEIIVSNIQSIWVKVDVPIIYLGESATAQNKSVISGLNTAGTSIKSYLLWYTQEIFSGIPETIELSGVFKTKYDSRQGWDFTIM